MSGSAFDYVDTAVGGVDHRNRVQRLAEFHPNGQPDCYTTWLRFTGELVTYVAGNRSPLTGKPSVGGYKGPGLATFLPMDFDCRDDPGRALAEARRFVTSLDERFGVDPRAIRSCFSGQKGVSLEIPATLFGGFEPGLDVADRARRLVGALADGLGLATLDPKIYERLRLWRVPNTRHGTSGLYKIPLTAEEFAALDIAAVRDLAARPREVAWYADEEWFAIPELVDLWRATAREEATEWRAPLDTAAALAGVPEGERDETIWRLACKLRGAGVPRDFAERLVTDAAATCDPPFSEALAREKVVRAYATYAPTPVVRIGQRSGASPRDPAPEVRAWPEPLAEEAFHGLAGEVVRAIAPHTEADPAALLINFLAAFGNAVGRGPHAVAEADRHGCNLFAVLVGETAKGRKGSSWGHVRELFRRLDPLWAASCVKSGLSSGEGMVWEVRDPIEKTDKDGDVKVVDEGVVDKRRLIVESEFASVLKVMTREGNTLSAIVRLAWDTGDLSTMVKNNPATATGAHFSIVGHVTKDELLRYLNDTEAGNGFANRYLWFCTRRARVLPEGGGPVDYDALDERLALALVRARNLGQLVRDDDARAIWAEVYPELSEGQRGLLGSVTARAEAYVLRLSVLYSALDASPVIRPAHLLAALAAWEYAEASARYIFGNALGDPIADQILGALRQSPDGLDREAISALFGRHRSAARLDQALTLLLSAGLARRETDSATGGRSREVWRGA